MTPHYPVPPNEQQRQATLEGYRILDTRPEERFDDITRLAALICNTPVSLMTMLDHGRQWFKSKVGITVSEMPRAIAFCTHAIMQPDVFVVPDASKDPLFANNPLVTNDPNVRFYAGAPLMAKNHSALGTICVLDVQPRDLSKEQLEALKLLSRQAMNQMELSYDLDRLREVLAERDRRDADREKLLNEFQNIKNQLDAVAQSLLKLT